MSWIEQTDYGVGWDDGIDYSRKVAEQWIGLAQGQVRRTSWNRFPAMNSETVIGTS